MEIAGQSVFRMGALGGRGAGEGEGGFFNPAASQGISRVLRPTRTSWWLLCAWQMVR